MDAGMMCTGTAKISEGMRRDVMTSQTSGKSVSRIVPISTA
jgi:hypothetical protein